MEKHSDAIVPRYRFLGCKRIDKAGDQLCREVRSSTGKIQRNKSLEILVSFPAGDQRYIPFCRLRRTKPEDFTQVML